MKKISIILIPLSVGCMASASPRLETRPILYVSEVRVRTESLEGQSCSHMSNIINNQAIAEGTNKDNLLREYYKKEQLFWNRFKSACAEVAKQYDASAIETFDQGCSWTIYINPEYDVTQEVIAWLNREYVLHRDDN